MEDKPVAERVKDCMAIIKKITVELGIPNESPEVTELRQRMNDYIRTGETWSGTVDFAPWGRYAECVFPKQAGKTVEVTLKKKLITKSRFNN